MNVLPFIAAMVSFYITGSEELARLWFSVWYLEGTK